MRGLCQVITDGKLWKPGTGHINKTKTYEMKKSFIAPYDTGKNKMADSSYYFILRNSINNLIVFARNIFIEMYSFV